MIKSCYQILLAIGICPKCGHIGDGFIKSDSLFCPHCAFYITTEEIKEIQKTIPGTMEKQRRAFLELFGRRT